VTLIVCLFSLFVASAIWPPTPSFEWTVTGFLGLSFLLASINLTRRVFYPTDLYFELTSNHLRIRDLRPSGHGYRSKTFEKSTIGRIHYSSDCEGRSYLEYKTGKKITIVGEILESWPEIRPLLMEEWPELVITEE